MGRVGRSLCMLAAVLAMPSVSPAQEFWERKPYTEWTEKECRRILEDSPWARQHLVSSISLRPLKLEPPTGEAPVTGPPGRESNPRIAYTGQVRSAMPVRQALVRLEQITAKYPAMSDEQRQAFDQRAQKFLDTSFAEAIVIYVEYKSNVPPYQSELSYHWQGVTLEQARNQMFLIIDGGEKTPPVQYVHQVGAGFHLVFARTSSNEPVVGPRARRMRVEFQHPRVAELAATQILLTFDLAQMQAQGKPAF